LKVMKSPICQTARVQSISWDAGIENEDMVDVGDYREYEIRAIAEQMLADRPKKD